MTANVLRAGFLSSVQDLGRPGWREHGVTPSGALDAHALAVANDLAGNEPSATGIEFTSGTMRLRFADERVVAWCGGDFDAQAGGVAMPAGRAGVVHRDEEFQITPRRGSGRAWLAISGGIDVPAVLGSRATDLRGKFGGFGGRPLSDGDALPLGRATELAAHLPKLSGRISPWSAPHEWANTARPHPILRVIRGADWSRFEPDAQAAFFRGPFEVTEESDRMGVRLRGPELARIDRSELLSEAVAPGTIQVPPDGNPIVLLGDCQTLGGYPKIAHVITVDLPGAAQLGPGDEVRFVEVSLAEAHRWLLQRARDLLWFRAGLALQNR